MVIYPVIIGPVGPGHPIIFFAVAKPNRPAGGWIFGGERFII